MPFLIITEVPENRRDIHVDERISVPDFQWATAALVANLNYTASEAFTRQTLSLWADAEESGGFAVRNGQLNDSWVMFEYVEGE